ncbi:MAG: hypothetical protein ACD_44C00281G0001 [uncultured bacterium]|nr:MAG: hypothetical protein ACD_44C00281G0001 [uncultured bacterium]
MNTLLKPIFLFWFLSLSLVFLLMQISGCTTMRRGTPDGPPSFYVNVDKIKNPVPKPLPKSRRGNPYSYVEFGKRYYVMDNSKGYCERGLASWYGMKFHQRHTSSGERFDTTSMTAAHKTLPLPTYALVTNLENGKQIIVKVNDRGPFHGNRIIDLSYVAAVKLGVYPKGTAHVEVKAIDPYQYQKKSMHSPFASQKQIHSPPPSGHYVKLGTFRKEMQARRTAKKAATLIQTNVRIIKQHKEKSDPHYFVGVGPLKNQTQAKYIIKALKTKGWETPLAIISY